MDSVPTLDELAQDPTRAARLSPDCRSQLLARCAAVLAALSAALMITPERSTDAPVQHVPDPNRLLCVPEVATLTGFAPSYVYEMIRRGDLPAVRHKKYVRVRACALQQWIVDHEWQGHRAPTSTPPASRLPTSQRRDGRRSTPTSARVASPELDDGGAFAPEVTV